MLTAEKLEESLRDAPPAYGPFGKQLRAQSYWFRAKQNWGTVRDVRRSAVHALRAFLLMPRIFSIRRVLAAAVRQVGKT